MHFEFISIIATIIICTLSLVAIFAPILASMFKEQKEFHARLCILEDRFLYFIGAPSSVPPGTIPKKKEAPETKTLQPDEQGAKEE